MVVEPRIPGFSRGECQGIIAKKKVEGEYMINNKYEIGQRVWVKGYTYEYDEAWGVCPFCKGTGTVTKNGKEVSCYTYTPFGECIKGIIRGRMYESAPVEGYVESICVCEDEDECLYTLDRESHAFKESDIFATEEEARLHMATNE